MRDARARRGRAPGLQRARIVDAMVFLVEERGFGGVTVGGVCARARVSRGSFYEVFDGLRDCFLAVIDDGYQRARALIAQAFEREEYWLDGVRAALASLLALFDDEPLLAWVWFVETLAAGAWALERRERHVAALTRMIVERWPIREDAPSVPLAAAGVMESVLGIIHTRLLTRRNEPLIGLLGPFMGLIAAIYLDASSAAAQIEQGEALAREIIAARPLQPGMAGDAPIPDTLRDPRAHRARECLLYLSAHPGASNREIAEAAGIARQAQISRLLARLSAQGLLTKHPGRPGGPNAWSLTSLGARVSRALEDEYDSDVHWDALGSA